MQTPNSRRRFLKNSTIYLTAIAAGATLASVSQSAQAAVISQADAGYQNVPKGGLQCKDCYYFNSADSTCKRGIASPITEHGFCNYFSAKS
jgi:anaerobic selenocysteine-containing dehydrogenase